ncbi:MAG: hypothetical protein ACR652_00845 [Methylocystis sp.]|uniref:hypothetical protein n=1 Tax=Methylocystis sp. TaxID=1911079 RepID=UPI003DA5C03F
MDDDRERPSYEARIEAAKNASVAEIYTNGFLTSLGPGDISLVLERNGRPVAMVNMSFTVAKTLAISLGSVIAQLEERTGRDMLTTHDLEKVYSQAGEASNVSKDGN